MKISLLFQRLNRFSEIIVVDSSKTSCARIVAREINNFKINDDNSYNIFELDAA